ncbi:MAG: hypothetical protein HOP29_02150 [Phycisphaerales bacterium]|nr:hypothetical protein [Phycisphaerales bacterium]
MPRAIADSAARRSQRDQNVQERPGEHRYSRSEGSWSGNGDGNGHSTRDHD